MKTLITFYSRTGTTRKVAELLKDELAKQNIRCDIEEIFDTKNRAGARGYISAGQDATFKKYTILKPLLRDPSEYDIVIVGTPIWAFTMSTPIRTYMHNHHAKFKNIAFFCTQSGSGSINTFKELAAMCNKEPIANMALLTKEVVKDFHVSKVKEFCEAINKAYLFSIFKTLDLDALALSPRKCARQTRQYVDWPEF